MFNLTAVWWEIYEEAHHGLEEVEELAKDPSLNAQGLDDLLHATEDYTTVLKTAKHYLGLI